MFLRRAYGDEWTRSDGTMPEYLAAELIRVQR